MVEQVFLLMGRFGLCIMQIYTAQQRGERRLKDRENLCLNFSCLAENYEYFFTLPSVIRTNRTRPSSVPKQRKTLFFESENGDLRAQLQRTCSPQPAVGGAALLRSCERRGREGGVFSRVWRRRTVHSSGRGFKSQCRARGVSAHGPPPPS